MPVWSWGSDGYGRLGHGTYDQHLVNPKEIAFFTDITLTTVDCGSAHNIAVDTEGRCFTWGKCHYGQLGHGEASLDEPIPRPVSSLSGIRIQSIGAGDSHVLAVTNTGAVYSWGVGFYGCLGHGDETHSSVPKLIEALSCIKHVSGGAYHSIAVDEEGRVFVWGRDNCGQIGQPLVSIPGLAKPIRMNQKKPVPYKDIPEGDSCIMVSACNNHTLILLSSGRIVSIGCNDNGELGRDDGNGVIIDPSVFVNSANGQIEPVKYVCAGWKHCAALTVSGYMYTWGHGAYGRLGLGHTRGQRKPTQVHVSDDRTGTKFRTVACGEAHTVAMDTSGGVWSCGSGHYGKLGIPLDVVLELQLVNSQLVSGVTGIVCGTNHTMAYQTSTLISA